MPQPDVVPAAASTPAAASPGVTTPTGEAAVAPEGMVLNRTAITGNLDIWTQREQGKEVAYVSGSSTMSDVQIRSELQDAKADYLRRIEVIDAVLNATDVRRHGPRGERRR